MLGIVSAATEAASDSQASIDRESVRTVWINQFEGDGTLPSLAMVSRMGVDALRRSQQVVDIHGDRHRRDLFQRGFKLRSPRSTVHNRGVHPIIQYLPVDVSRAREPSGWSTRRRLLQDVGNEQIGCGFDVRGIKARLECSGP